jgi:hypothetical protein
VLTLTGSALTNAGATAADVSTLTPLFDRVLIKVAEAKAASKGGVLLPGTPAAPRARCCSERTTLLRCWRVPACG